jgi:hypothetical protein
MFKPMGSNFGHVRLSYGSMNLFPSSQVDDNTLITLSVCCLFPHCLRFKILSMLATYIVLAEMPGVAREYIRNKGTREINYGII